MMLANGSSTQQSSETKHNTTLRAAHFFQRLAAHLPVKEPDRVVVSLVQKAEPPPEPKDW